MVKKKGEAGGAQMCPSKFSALLLLTLLVSSVTLPVKLSFSSMTTNPNVSLISPSPFLHLSPTQPASSLQPCRPFTADSIAPSCTIFSAHTPLDLKV